MANKSPRRIAIIWVICVVVCSGLLTGLVSAVKAAREQARCTVCGFHLKQIGLGLKIFDQSNDGLPPAYLCGTEERPMHSWHALLMPYIGRYGWRDAYTLKEPWNGPTNKKCLSWSYEAFHCPTVGDDSRLAFDYVAVVGPDTMWPGRQRVALSLGGKDTILLIELPDSDYRCLEPRFPTVDEFIERIKSPTGKGIRCIHPKGLAYLTVGGEVRWFPPDTDPETIRPLFKRDPSCKVIPPEEKMPIVEHWEENAKDPR